MGWRGRPRREKERERRRREKLGELPLGGYSRVSSSARSVINTVAVCGTVRRQWVESSWMIRSLVSGTLERRIARAGSAPRGKPVSCERCSGILTDATRIDRRFRYAEETRTSACERPRESTARAHILEKRCSPGSSRAALSRNETWDGRPPAMANERTKGAEAVFHFRRLKGTFLWRNPPLSWSGYTAYIYYLVFYGRNRATAFPCCAAV